MKIEQAIKLINPETTVEAVEEVRYYGGLNANEKAYEAMKEAREIACYCMGKDIPKVPERIDNDPDCDIAYYVCPTCGRKMFSYSDNERCVYCGQLLKK